MSRPRRLLVLCRDFPPDVSASSFGLLRWAKYLPQAGWRPHFLALRNEWGTVHHDAGLAAEVPGRTRVDRVASWSPEERIDRYFGRGRFASSPHARPNSRSPAARRPAPSATRGRGLRSRLIGLLRPIWALLWRTPDPMIWSRVPMVRRGRALAQHYRFDAILSMGPPHSLHLAGLALERALGLPLVVDLQDPWAVQPFGPDLNPLGRRLSPRFEARVVRSADHVVLNTPRALAFYAARYPDERSKLSTIPNGFDPAYRPKPRAIPNRRSSRRFQLCHSGVLYGQRDLRPFLTAMAEQVDAGVDLHLEQIGFHHPRFDLPGAIARHGLDDRVKLVPRLNHDAVLERMRDADGFLVVQPNAPLQVPGKLYEMMLFDRPILALSGDGATADLIRQHDLGAVAAHDDVAAISTALRDLIERSSSESESTTRREPLDRYDGRRLARELAELLDGVLSRRNLG